MSKPVNMGHPPPHRSDCEVIRAAGGSEPDLAGTVEIRAHAAHMPSLASSPAQESAKARAAAGVTRISCVRSLHAFSNLQEEVHRFLAEFCVCALFELARLFACNQIIGHALQDFHAVSAFQRRYTSVALHGIIRLSRAVLAALHSRVCTRCHECPCPTSVQEESALWAQNFTVQERLQDDVLPGSMVALCIVSALLTLNPRA